MKLLTTTICEQLLRNGRIRQERAQDDSVEPDFIPVVKLFTPDAACTWFLTELDLEEPDIAFGLCDLGMGCPELGSVRISELESVRGRLGLRSSAISISFRSTRSRSMPARRGTRAPSPNARKISRKPPRREVHHDAPTPEPARLGRVAQRGTGRERKPQVRAADRRSPRHHAAMLAAIVEEAMRLREEARLVAQRLNNGEPGIPADDNSPSNVLVRETAAPRDTVPLWGQERNFVVTVGAMRVRNAMDGVFGIASSTCYWPGFGAHAIDQDQLFLSETGYRSFLGIHAGPVPQITPDEFARRMIESYVMQEFKGKLALSSRNTVRRKRARKRPFSQDRHLTLSEEQAVLAFTCRSDITHLLCRSPACSRSWLGGNSDSAAFCHG